MEIPSPEQSVLREKKELLTPPEFVYHASIVKDLKILTPSLTNKSEVPQLFAGNNPAWTSVFLFRAPDEWCMRGAFANDEGDVLRYCAIADREQFEAIDTGGAIYKLPGSSFASNLDIFPRRVPVEWVSSVAVEPVEAVQYSSGLAAMLELGVQVFFVTPDQLADFRSDAQEGWLRMIETESENTRTGRGIRNLRDFPHPV